MRGGGGLGIGGKHGDHVQPHIFANFLLKNFEVGDKCSENLSANIMLETGCEQVFVCIFKPTRGVFRLWLIFEWLNF